MHLGKVTAKAFQKPVKRFFFNLLHIAFSRSIFPILSLILVMRSIFNMIETL